jgi:pimeloyl-ACP methyl ester carboxylesterase
MPELTVNRATLHYEDEGAGRPVVFVHGVWMSGRFFERQRPYFRDRYRTIVLDLRSHGRSPHVHEGHTVAQYARDLDAVIGELGLTGAVVVGWSMGALVIWDYVRQFGSGSLGGVVVVDQSPSDYRWPDWPHGFLDFEGLCHVMSAVQTDREALVRDFLPLMFKEPPTEHDKAWMVEEILRLPASVASAIIFDQTVQDYRSVLPSVTVPALVVTGADEKLVPVAAEEEVASQLPDARLVVFEESGHCPFLEEPDRFNQVVDEFVAQLQP